MSVSGRPHSVLGPARRGPSRCSAYSLAFPAPRRLAPRRLGVQRRGMPPAARSNLTWTLVPAGLESVCI